MKTTCLTFQNTLACPSLCWVWLKICLDVKNSTSISKTALALFQNSTLLHQSIFSLPTMCYCVSLHARKPLDQFMNQVLHPLLIKPTRLLRGARIRISGDHVSNCMTTSKYKLPNEPSELKRTPHSCLIYPYPRHHSLERSLLTVGLRLLYSLPLALPFYPWSLYLTASPRSKVG